MAVDALVHVIMMAVDSLVPNIGTKVSAAIILTTRFFHLQQNWGDNKW